MRPLASYTLPVLLFSIIWGAVEFLVPIRYSEAGVSVGLVSVLFAISSALSVLLDIPSGKLSDRIGRERMIVFSMIVSIAALLLLYFFSSFPAFLTASVLVGVAYGLNWSPLLALVGDKTEDGNHGRVFGGFFALSALGEAIAPILIVFLAIYTGVTFSFLALAFAALACALIFIYLLREKNERLRPEAISIGNFSYRGTFELIKKSTGTSLFLFALGFFVAFFWQSVWFTQPLVGFYEKSLLDSALIIVAFSLPAIFFSKPLGKLIDRAGEKKVFLCSIAAVVVSFASFYLSPGITEKMVSIFAAAIGVLGIWLVLDVLTVKTHLKDERGKFFGILETVRDGSYVITPLFIGSSYKFIGLDGIFVVNSVIAVALLFFGTYLFKKTEIPSLH